MKRSTDVADWPIHLHSIFAAIGAGMDGKRLSPEVVNKADVSAAIPDHKVSIEHRRTDGLTGNHYVIEISGPRIDGRWPFRSGELERLARLSTHM